MAATSDQERDEIVTGTQGRLCISGGESTITGDSAEAILREYTSEAAWALQRGDGGWEITESEVVSP